MDEVVRKDAISTLSRVIEIFEQKEEKDIAEIREVSNHTIHNASVFQDDVSVSLAVLIYSLSKIIERKGKLDYNKILSLLEEAKVLLDRERFEDYHKTIKRIINFISNIDSKMKLYIEEVFNQAQIKKGCKLCEHGVSVARSSEILGISQWELMNYLGKTKLTDGVPDIIDLKTRITFARGLFK